MQMLANALRQTVFGRLLRHVRTLSRGAPPSAEHATTVFQLPGRSAPDHDDEAPRPIPLLGRLSETGQRRLTFTLGFVFLAAAAATALVGWQMRAYKDRYVGYAQTIGDLGTRMYSAATLAALGDPRAFTSGAEATQRTRVAASDLSLTEEYTPEVLRQRLSTADIWEATKQLVQKVETILAQQGTITGFAAQAGTLRKGAERLDAAVQRLSGSSTAPAQAMQTAGRRILRGAYAVAAADESAAAELGAVGPEIERAIDAAERLNAVPERGDNRSASVEALAAARAVREQFLLAERSYHVVVASRKRAAESFELAERLATLTRQRAAAAATSGMDNAAFAAALALLLGAVGAFVLGQIVAARAGRLAGWHAEREKDASDHAIIELMTELQPIAQGDLTARARVTEHFTGALADSINAAAESMQEAIGAVKHAVFDVGTHINAISAATRTTFEVADVAATRAAATNDEAAEGQRIVGAAVGRMNAAREQMQAVNKRVKRLGELTQGIGAITLIMEEITEKTAILALNTSLKATEAGEEGHAFRVIAGEIGKLSENAKTSLHQIATAVQAIQGEAHTVMQTVEEATGEVVEGSRLWNEAGQALARINDASMHIAGVVGELHRAAQDQAADTQAALGVMATLSESAERFRTGAEQHA